MGIIRYCGSLCLVDDVIMIMNPPQDVMLIMLLRKAVMLICPLDVLVGWWQPLHVVVGQCEGCRFLMVVVVELWRGSMM